MSSTLLSLPSLLGPRPLFHPRHLHLVFTGLTLPPPIPSADSLLSTNRLHRLRVSRQCVQYSLLRSKPGQVIACFTAMISSLFFLFDWFAIHSYSGTLIRLTTLIVFPCFCISGMLLFLMSNCYFVLDVGVGCSLPTVTAQNPGVSLSFLDVFFFLSFLSYFGFD